MLAGASLHRYFSLQATEQLGMGDEARVEIEMRICEERGPRADSYLPTQLQAYDTMNEARNNHVPDNNYKVYVTRGFTGVCLYYLPHDCADLFFSVVNVKGERVR